MPAAGAMRPFHTAKQGIGFLGQLEGVRKADLAHSAIFAGSLRRELCRLSKLGAGITWG
jgi:hypothetical protein